MENKSPAHDPSSGTAPERAYGAHQVPPIAAEPFQLSLAQRAIWLDQALTPDVAYVVAQYTDIYGELDIALLADCSDEVAAEFLSPYVRLVDSAAPEGVPWQFVDPRPSVTTLPLVDLSDRSDPETAALEWMRSEYSSHLDVHTSDLYLQAIIKIAPDRHYWYVRAHHLIIDGVGASTMSARISEVFTARSRGEEPPAPTACHPHILLEEERKYSTSARRAGDIEHWRRELEQMPPIVALSGKVEPPAALNHRVNGPLGEGDSALVDAAAQRLGTTPAGLVIGAFAAYLARMTDVDRVSLTLPVAARVSAKTRRSAGMAAGVVPLVVDVAAQTKVSALIAQVGAGITGALRHQMLSIPELAALRSDTSDQASLFGPTMNIMLFSRAVQLGDLVGTLHLLTSGPASDIAVTVYEADDGGVRLDVEGNPNAYSVEELTGYRASFVDYLRRFTHAAADSFVIDVDLLGDADSEAVGLVNETAVAYLDSTLPELFAAQVRRTPDRIALVGPDETELTYEQFSGRVNALARHLIHLGVGPESRVALGLRRSVDLLVGIYAVLTSGGAYVPLDPEHPAERKRNIVEDSGARVLLVHSLSDSSVVESEDLVDHVVSMNADAAVEVTDPIADGERKQELRPDNVAYVIFTSGSTGRPKGVAVSHRNAVNQVRWMASQYDITPDDIVLFKTPQTFDISVWELFTPLSVGAPLVIAKHGGHGDPQYIAETVHDRGITLISFTPSLLAIYLANTDPALSASLTKVFVAGEATHEALAVRFAELLDAELHNVYGPTECTVHATYARIDGGTGSVPIGIPLWNTRAFVLDHHLRPTARGAVGELYLAGDQVARGYIGRPGLTAGVFVANTIDGDGSRMYRTGDLARWRLEGPTPMLDYLGRKDFQVKLHGQRIELGEVESALLRLSEVAQAAVVVHHHPHRGDNLAAYLAPTTGMSIDHGDVTRRLREVLPSYMVPTLLTTLDALPANASGKVDRKALPEPAAPEAARYRAPETAMQELIASVFVSVLGVETVGLDADFFGIGGNSLSATQVAAQLSAATGRNVRIREIFSASTVETLSAIVEELDDNAPHRALAAVERPDIIPLSLAQQRMWFLHRLDPSSAAYNVPFALRIRGALSVDALRAAFADLIERHETLRTVYPDSVDGARQQVRAAHPLDLTVENVAEADVAPLITQEFHRPFDLLNHPSIRARLLRLNGRADEYLLAINLHHISADGWSLAPLTHDLVTAYAARIAGRSPQWEQLPVQYADYTLWQRSALGDPSDDSSLAGRQLAYWRRTLDGLSDISSIPTDRPRTAERDLRGGKVALRIDEQTYSALTELAREHNVTAFMVAHAALAVLLARTGEHADVVIGTPIAGRGEAALDDLIGMFVNTLVLRTPVDIGADFHSLLDVVREVDTDALSHSDVPFELVVDAVNPPRSAGFSPLFQVAMAFQNLRRPAINLGETDIEVIEADDATEKFDLTFTFHEQHAQDGTATHVEGSLSYAAELFDLETITALAQRFERLITALVTDPSAVVGDAALLTADQEVAVVEAAGADRRLRAGGTLVDSFARAASAHPNAVALTHRDTAITYRELDKRSNRVAHALIEHGVGPEDLVALALPREAGLVVAALGILKAGGAYVPIDTTYPQERLRHILSDSRPAMVLTAASTVADVPATGAESVDFADLEARAWNADPVTDTDRRPPLRPDHLAYIIYTSGSTGLPKGVAVEHRNVLELMAASEEYFDFGAYDVWTLFHSFSFDFSVWELWGPLLTGGRLVIVDHVVSRSPEQFLTLLADEGVTVLNQTPSAFYQLAEAERLADPAVRERLALRFVIFGGEAVDFRQLGRWVERHLTAGPALINMYGITETTVHVTFQELTPELALANDASIIGVGLPGLRVYVLDERLHPVPTGVAGELYVAGPQLSRGYLHRPDLSATRFVANPFTAGERLYRTGDIGRRRRDGSLEYTGRADSQVQLRGFRIELGEVEATLLEIDGVAAAVAVVHESETAGQRLVAYLVPEANRPLDVASAREAASGFLTSYMVPDVLMVLDALPLTGNGKLDRRALPEPVAQVAHRKRVAPRTEVERVVVSVFTDLLGAEGIGVTDSFFELGGNSLLSTRAVARVNAALSASLTVRDLFDAPTPEGIARAAETSITAGGSRPKLGVVQRPERPPLSPAQTRMWFWNRLDGTSALYNIPILLRIRGVVDESAVQAALTDVIDRHEPLRTVYPSSEDGPWQRVLTKQEAAPHIRAETIGVGSLLARIAELTAEGFDVTVDAPVRAALLTTAPDEHVLLLVVHHIAADGWSLAPLVRDWASAYQARATGEAPQFAPLPVQYADFAVWQRELFGTESAPTEAARAQIEFWRTTLDGAPEETVIPFDRRRPEHPAGRGAVVTGEIGADLHRDLLQLATSHDVTAHMLGHTALAILIARLADVDDVVIGSPTAGRGDEALDDLVGMFVGTLLLRAPVDGSRGFAENLRRIGRHDLDALAHAELPFERLVDELNPPRVAGRNPFFQIMYSYENDLTDEFSTAGLTVAPEELDMTSAKFDLHFTLLERNAAGAVAAGIELRLVYDTELYDEVTAARLLSRLVRVLEAAVATPDLPVQDIGLMDENEQRALQAWSEGGPGPAPDLVMADILGAGVRIAPERLAVVAGDRGLTYRELDHASSVLAHELIDCGAGPGAVIGMLADRSEESVLAVHAIVKTGAAYLPIDPSYPSERIVDCLRDARVTLGVTTRPDLAALSPEITWAVLSPVRSAELLERVVEPLSRVELTPEHPAYVIYTSGSTGKPKGVVVTQAGLAAYVRAQRAYGVTADSRVMHFVSPGFDASTLELVLAASAGAALVVIAPQIYGGTDLERALVDGEVTHGFITPSALATVRPSAVPSLAAVGVGGEASSPELVRRWQQAGTTLLNIYGPTETTIAVLQSPFGTQAPVTAGRPIDGIAFQVLDDRLQMVPAGVVGELYVAGAGVAQGYHDRAALTSARFVADPAGVGGRMYRSGDLARWTADGRLEVVGRSDFQVKIRGFRIELGEIESVYAGHDDLDQAVAIARHDGGDARIVVYLVPASGRRVEDIDTAALHSLAVAALPHFMVPSSVVVLDDLPRTVNGKLDRRRLPEPDHEAGDDRPYAAPEGPDETLVAEVMGRVLDLPTENIGRHDHFFEVGGNSLSAVRAVDLLRAEVANTTPDAADTVSIRWFFESPTVAAIAAKFAAVREGGARASTQSPFDVVLPIRTTGSSTPLFCVHPAVGLAWSFGGLAQHLPADVPVYGLQARSLTETDPAASVEDLAADYLREIREIAPQGPYRLVGWSFGGLVAQSMATQLERAGERVELLAMLDSFPLHESASPENDLTLTDLLKEFAGLTDVPPGVTVDQAVTLLHAQGGIGAHVTRDQLARLYEGYQANVRYAHEFEPAPFSGDLLFFTATEFDDKDRPTFKDWSPFIAGRINDVPIHATHGGMTAPEHLPGIARRIADRL